MLVVTSPLVLCAYFMITCTMGDVGSGNLLVLHYFDVLYREKFLLKSKQLNHSLASVVY